MIFRKVSGSRSDLQGKIIQGHRQRHHYIG